MKLLRSKKALSPVVASIILIAVTVAVSIAVAAWMGALTIGFMGSSSITITDYSFLPVGSSGDTNNSITIVMKNTGTKQVTIANVKINNAVKTFSGNTTIDAGATGKTLTIYMGTVGWSNGNPYKIDLYDSSGSIVGSTQPTAPGT